MTDDGQLNQIMAIMDSAFDPHWREAWTRQQVASSLILPNTHVITVDADGNLTTQGAEAAGFVLARRAAGEEELLLVAVEPSKRRRGLGLKLLKLFIENAKQHGSEKIFLEMRDANPAEALYRRCGFTPIGRRKSYYRTLDGSPVDAITFARDV